MKIKTLAAAQTAFLHLKGPDGTYLYEDGQKVGITLYSPGSPQFARVDERQTARTAQRMNDNEGRITPASTEVRRANQAEDLTDLTAGFQHIEHDGPDGEPLSGRELHLSVYSEPTLGWIKEQALKFLADWGKFTAASATS